MKMKPEDLIYEVEKEEAIWNVGTYECVNTLLIRSFQTRVSTPRALEAQAQGPGQKGPP